MESMPEGGPNPKSKIQNPKFRNVETLTLQGASSNVTAFGFFILLKGEAA
jgi:hypothetical protein